MRYLVDTHYLIWSLLDPKKIKNPAREILLDPFEIKYVSKISFWEIALKYSLGKLQLSGVLPELLVDASIKAGFKLLEISEEDLATSYNLPAIKLHKDPFDRILIWQCIRNQMAFISSDSRTQEYSKYGLKIVPHA